MSAFTDAAVDPAILARARRGDTKAHEVLYRAYSRGVYTLAFRLVKREAVADEVLQETFVEVISKIGTFKGDGSFAGWLRRIAVTKALMHLRSPWYLRSRPLEPSQAPWTEPAAHGGDGVPPTERLSDQMDLEAALARLPARTRAVVWLHDVEGYTHEEIGDLMGRTASFSKSQLARAHERLRDMLSSARGTESCMQVSSSS